MNSILKWRHLPMLILLTIILGCEKTAEPFSTGRPDAKVWAVPIEEVVDAGVGKDGIPSVDNPQFTKASEVNNAFDNDFVLGIEYNGTLRAYPIPMLNWHEIINDEINGLSLAITYCPLTGTGIGWSRLINGAETSFGVSGFLYNNNLMPYDRLTGSTWSQQRVECVNGLFLNEKPETYTLIETTFKTWKAAFPDSEVMNANTGFDRRYSVYPYGDYLTNQELLFFPLSNLDNRLPPKERVLGVIKESEVMAFQFNEEGKGLDLIKTNVGGDEIVVLRSKDLQILSAFYTGDRKLLAMQNMLPVVMMDELGNGYDLSGKIIEGPQKGAKLDQPQAFMGFWFSWGAFYPNIKL